VAFSRKATWLNFLYVNIHLAVVYLSKQFFFYFFVNSLLCRKTFFLFLCKKHEQTAPIFSNNPSKDSRLNRDSTLFETFHDFRINCELQTERQNFLVCYFYRFCFIRPLIFRLGSKLKYNIFFYTL